MKFLPSSSMFMTMAVMVTAVTAFAAPAHADWDHDWDHDRHHGRYYGRYYDGYHDWGHHRHWWHGRWIVDEPVYAPPPPVVYAPPPPSPGFNLIVPLHIR